MSPLNAEGLRACQVEAVNGVEASLAQNHPRALVQMATGAGKTYTAATLSYRLLAHAGFRRSCFSPTAPISCGRRATNISLWGIHLTGVHLNWSNRTSPCRHPLP